MNNGWIKLHRSLLDWEWYSDMNVRIVFIHCLLKANSQDVKLKGLLIKRGSFPTGLEKLAKETGLTIAQIRVTLNKLKMTNEITSQSSPEGSIISITNYDLYQSNDKQNDKQIANEMTNESQTNDKPIATNKNNKKLRIKEIQEEIQKPDDVSDASWIAWLKIKKSKNQILTEYALSRFINLADKFGMTTQELIDFCIDKNWASATKEYLLQNGKKMIETDPEEQLEFEVAK